MSVWPYRSFYFCVAEEVDCKLACGVGYSADAPHLPNVNSGRRRFAALHARLKIYFIDLGDSYDTNNVTVELKIYFIDLGDSYDTNNVTVELKIYFLDLGDSYDTNNGNVELKTALSNLNANLGP